MRVVSFTLNGTPTQLTLDERRPLLWVLRDDLGLTGTNRLRHLGVRRLHRTRERQSRALLRHLGRRPGRQARRDDRGARA
jgi:hypothetical protein